MNTIFKTFLQCILLSGIVLISSCEKESDQTDDTQKEPKTAKEVMEENEKYSHMNEAVEESEQESYFADANANITVFVATNAAFEDLFAEANVNSISELEAKMGEEEFARLVMYHAINGKFNYESFENGSHETEANNSNNEPLTVFVENENDTRLLLNGDNQNGASTTSSEVITASNGNLIEINAVLSAQSNYENIEDAEKENNSGSYVSFMANAESSLQTMLQGENSESQVLVTNNGQTETVLNLYLENILDEDDLDNLLSATAKSTLYTQYSVSTMAELLVEVTINDLLNVGSVTMANIYAELEAEDKTEYLNHLIFQSSVELETLAENSGSITSEAGYNFDVDFNSQGQVVLTNSTGTQMILEEDVATGVNGSAYTIAEIK